MRPVVADDTNWAMKNNISLPNRIFRFSSYNGLLEMLSEKSFETSSNYKLFSGRNCFIRYLYMYIKDDLIILFELLSFRNRNSWTTFYCKSDGCDFDKVHQSSHVSRENWKRSVKTLTFFITNIFLPTQLSVYMWDEWCCKKII